MYITQEDSINLWKSLVSNELLRNTNLILFLNKIDIMKEKLRAGIKLANFVLSYGNRQNDYEHASACEFLFSRAAFKRFE